MPNFDILKGKKILIVEDDENLSFHLKSLFKSYTNVDPKVCNCMKDAIDVIKEEKVKYDLAVVDLMLPTDENMMNKIRNFERRLAEIRDELEALSLSRSDEKEKYKSKELRAERDQIMIGVQLLVKKEGGIELIETWRNCKNDLSNIPILFLAAIGDDSIIQRGLNIAGKNSDWVIKPTPSELIIDKCILLLNK